MKRSNGERFTGPATLVGSLSSVLWSAPLALVCCWAILGVSRFTLAATACFMVSVLVAGSALSSVGALVASASVIMVGESLSTWVGFKVPTGLLHVGVLVTWISGCAFLRGTSGKARSPVADRCFVIGVCLVVGLLEFRFGAVNRIGYLLGAEDNATWIDLFGFEGTSLERARQYGPSVGLLIRLLDVASIRNDPARAVLGLHSVMLGFSVGLSSTLLLPTRLASSGWRSLRIAFTAILGAASFMGLVVSTYVLFGALSLEICLVGLLLAVLFSDGNSLAGSLTWTSIFVFAGLTWTPVVPMVVGVFVFCAFSDLWLYMKSRSSGPNDRELHQHGLTRAIVWTTIALSLTVYFFAPTDSWVARGSHMKLMLLQAGGVPNTDAVLLVVGVILGLVAVVSMSGVMTASLRTVDLIAPSMLLLALGYCVTVVAADALLTDSEPGYGTRKLLLLLVPWCIVVGVPYLGRRFNDRDTLSSTDLASLIMISVATVSLLVGGTVRYGLANLPGKLPVYIWDDALEKLETGVDPAVCTTSDPQGLLGTRQSIDWSITCTNFVSARFGSRYTVGMQWNEMLNSADILGLKGMLIRHPKLRLLVIPDSTTGTFGPEPWWEVAVPVSERQVEFARTFIPSG